MSIPNYQRLAELFQHLITISLAAIGFLFTTQSITTFPKSQFSSWAIGLFAVSVVSGLFGYVAITSLSLGERPKRDIFLFQPKFWFYPTWVAFTLALASCLAIVFF